MADDVMDSSGAADELCAARGRVDKLIQRLREHVLSLNENARLSPVAVDNVRECIERVQAVEACLAAVRDKLPAGPAEAAPSLPI